MNHNRLYFDPTSRTGPDGYINYKMSGGGSGSSGGGSGCGWLLWVLIILAVLELIGEIAG